MVAVWPTFTILALPVLDWIFASLGTIILLEVEWAITSLRHFDAETVVRFQYSSDEQSIESSSDSDDMSYPPFG